VRISKSLAALTMAIATGSAGVALGQHWSYEGEAGPQNWGKLDAKFALCATGKNQSPIDLSGFVEADLKPLKLTTKRAARTSSTTDIPYKSITRREVR
jgi:carbonic anhydrase